MEFSLQLEEHGMHSMFPIQTVYLDTAGSVTTVNRIRTHRIDCYTKHIIVNAGVWMTR